MRFVRIVVSGLIGLFVHACFAADFEGVEWNTDRPGADFRNFDLSRADPGLCRDACAREAGCKAWTYVKPNTIQGPRPRCWLKRSVPKAIKKACCVSGVKGRPAPAPHSHGGMEWNVDRPGADFRNFDLSRAEPELCRNACAKDGRCKAWTYVKPNTIQGPRPRCWLKRSVPKAIKKACCVSGVKGRPAPAPHGPGGMERNVDRPGSDFHNFDLSRADPGLCRSACIGDARCKAWTYVKPNTIQGPHPRCWLKHAVPKAVSRDCCVSGVK